jgi:hypothetical protein
MEEPLIHISLQPQRVHLQVRRAPKYLRFVRDEARKWDALDQLDDVPRPGEQVVAAKAMRRGTVHLDRRVNGRHVGDWEEYVEYEAVADQPADETLRDRAKWADWCYSQQQAEEGK